MLELADSPLVTVTELGLRLDELAKELVTEVFELDVDEQLVVVDELCVVPGVALLNEVWQLELLGILLSDVTHAVHTVPEGDVELEALEVAVVQVEELSVVETEHSVHGILEVITDVDDSSQLVPPEVIDDEHGQ